MHSVLSCLVTDVIGPGTIADDLVATVAGDFNHEGGEALREYSRSIELVLRALELEKGDRVILSPLAPAAYRSLLYKAGVEIVFADVRGEDACLDPLSVADRMSTDVKVIFVHAPLGQVPDMAALSDFGVPLVCDIGEALGARYASEELGSFGRYLLLPMETDGIATSGGGTLVLAKDKTALTALKKASEGLSVDAFLPDLNASLGLVQWREYPQALESRDMIADVFRQALMKGRHRTFAIPEDQETRAVPYSFPVVVSSGVNAVRKYARKKGIETRWAFAQRVIEESPDADERCPQGRSLMMSTILFPLYPTLGKKNILLIVKVLSTLP